MRTLLAMCLLLAAIDFAVAGTREPRNSDQSHLDYGSQFHSVAKIRCRRDDGQWQAASCVVVSPRRAITAAHVVDKTVEWQVVVGDTAIPASSVKSHPQFNRDKPGSHDIAVVSLDADVLLEYYPELYRGRDEVGCVVSIAGYGLTGTMSAGFSISDGRLRAGSNTVEKCEGGVLVCTAGNYGSPSTSLEFAIAPGDSGGGLFVGRFLAGVHSFVSVRGSIAPKSRYGDETAHTRISEETVILWLDEVLGQ
jgi:hypothetical protein